MTASAAEAPSTLRSRVATVSPWLVVAWAGTALYTIVLAAGSIYEHSPLQTNFDDHDLAPPWSGAERREIRELLDRIPPDAAVAASQPLLPQLSRRAELYTLPEPFAEADWRGALADGELAERARRVDYAVLVGEPDKLVLPIAYVGTVAEVRAELIRQRLAPVTKVADVELFERP